MSGLIDIASRIMMTAERRLDQTAANLANLGTSGYRSSIIFSDMIVSAGLEDSVISEKNSELTLKSMVNFTSGGLVVTGSPLDFSISGEGYFCVRTDAGEAYTRNGRFQQSTDGRIVTMEGYALQDTSGGDIIIQSEVPVMLPDGTLVEGGLPVGRIGVFTFGEALSGHQESGVFVTAPEGISPILSGSAVRQGVYENSNVSVPAEMIEMMRAVKQAESGARLAQTYDGLLGQAITTFGQRR